MFYLQNLKASITTGLTSKTNEGSHAQLVVSFAGNNNFPSGNPFIYTSNS